MNTEQIAQLSATEQQLEKTLKKLVKPNAAEAQLQRVVSAAEETVSAHKQEIQRFEAKIEETNAELQVLFDDQVGWRGRLQDNKAKLRAQREVISTKISEKRKALDAIDDARAVFKTKITRANKLKKSLPFESVELVDSAMQDLSTSLMVDTMSLQNEKLLLKQQANLKASKDTIHEYQDIESGIQQQRKTLDELYTNTRSQNDSVNASIEEADLQRRVVEALAEKGDEKFANISTLNESREALYEAKRGLRAQMDAQYEAKRAALKECHAAKDAYFQCYRELAGVRKAIRAARAAERAAERQSSLTAYVTECRAATQNPHAREAAAVQALQQALAAHLPRPGAKAKALRRRCVLSLDTFDALARVGVPAPSCAGDVPAALAALAARLLDYQRAPAPAGDLVDAAAARVQRVFRRWALARRTAAATVLQRACRRVLSARAATGDGLLPIPAGAEPQLRRRDTPRSLPAAGCRSRCPPQLGCIVESDEENLPESPVTPPVTLALSPMQLQDVCFSVNNKNCHKFSFLRQSSSPSLSPMMSPLVRVV